MNAINEYLKRTGTTQVDFGRKLNVGQSMVNQWIAQKRPVSIGQALNIEDAFGIDAELINPEIAIITNRLLKRLKKHSRKNAR